MIALAIFVLIIRTGKDTNEPDHHDHAWKQQDCSTIALAFQTSHEKYKALSKLDQQPVSEFTIIFQEIADEASTQAVFSPFTTDEPGDRASIEIDELSFAVAAKNFIHSEYMQDYAVDTIQDNPEAQEVADVYCAVRELKKFYTTDHNHSHMAVIIRSKDSVETVKIEFTSDVDADSPESYTWTIDAKPDDEPLTDAFCQLVRKDMSPDHMLDYTACSSKNHNM